jgi:hypothetical protein
MGAYINVEPPPSVLPLFETDATEVLETSNSKEIQIATQAVLSEGGTVTGISAYVKGPSNRDLRYAIYTDNSGQPGDLIVESAVAGTLSSEFAWQEIAVTPTHLTAGTYWLALAFEFRQQYFNHSAAGQGQTRYKNNDAVGNGFTAQWNSSDQSGTERISIYASYTPD